MRRFYDERGWKVDDSGIGFDTALFEDLRPSAAVYTSATNRRVIEDLPKNGGLFLDAGSSLVQYPEYLEYSIGFSKGVCVDLREKRLFKPHKNWEATANMYK